MGSNTGGTRQLCAISSGTVPMSPVLDIPNTSKEAGGRWRVLKDYVPHLEVASIISSLKAVHEQQTRHCTMHAFTHTQYVAGLVTKLGADVTQCARLGHNAASK